MRLIDQNRQRLLQAAEVVSKDFAFRQAVATGDSPTIASVLNNHGARIRPVMLLVSPDNMLRRFVASGGPRDRSHILADPVGAARGQGLAIMQYRKRPYQVVVVPVLAPDPIAWVAMGFRSTRAFWRPSRAHRLHVSFLAAAGRRPAGVPVHHPPERGRDRYGARAARRFRRRSGPAPARRLRHRGHGDSVRKRRPRCSSATLGNRRPRALRGLKSLLALLTIRQHRRLDRGQCGARSPHHSATAVLDSFAAARGTAIIRRRVSVNGDEEIGTLSASFNTCWTASQHARLRSCAWPTKTL